MSEGPVNRTPQTLPVRRAQQDFARLALVGFVGLAGVAAWLGQPMLCDLCIAEVFFISNQIVKRPASVLHEDVIELEAPLPTDCQEKLTVDNLEKEKAKSESAPEKSANKDELANVKEGESKLDGQEPQPAPAGECDLLEGDMFEIPNTQTHVIEKATEHVPPPTAVDREDDKTTDTDTCQSVPVTLPRPRRDSTRRRSLRIENFESPETSFTTPEVKELSLTDASSSPMSLTPVPAILLTPPMSPDLAPGGYTMQFGQFITKTDSEADIDLLLQEIGRSIQQAEGINGMIESPHDSPQDQEFEQQLEEAFLRFGVGLTEIEPTMTETISEGKSLSRRSSLADSISEDWVIVEKEDAEPDEGMGWEDQAMHSDTPAHELNERECEPIQPHDEAISQPQASQAIPSPPDLIVVTADNDDVRILYPITPETSSREDNRLICQDMTYEATPMKVDETITEATEAVKEPGVEHPILIRRVDGNSSEIGNLIEDIPPISSMAISSEKVESEEELAHGGLRCGESQSNISCDGGAGNKSDEVTDDANGKPQSWEPQQTAEELQLPPIILPELSAAESKADEEPIPMSPTSKSETPIPVENATIVDRIKHLRRNRSDSMGTVDNFSNISSPGEIVSAIRTPSLSSLRSKSSKKVTFALERSEAPKKGIAEAAESVSSLSDEDDSGLEETKKSLVDEIEMTTDVHIDSLPTSITALPLSTPLDSSLPDNTSVTPKPEVQQGVAVLDISETTVRDSELVDVSSDTQSDHRYPPPPELDHESEPNVATAEMKGIETADSALPNNEIVDIQAPETRPTSSHSEARSSMTSGSGKHKKWPITVMRSLSTRINSLKPPRNSQSNTPSTPIQESDDSNLPKTKSNPPRHRFSLKGKGPLKRNTSSRV